MGRHSKHNTASGHFTYAEYRMLADRWGTQRARLGAESVRRFDSCSLCLQDAREPVCCNEGHVFCKECILQDLLTQKASIEKFKAELGRWEREEEAERQIRVQQARERVLRDFETRHQTLSSSSSASTSKSGEEGEKSGSGLNSLKRKDPPESTAPNGEGSNTASTLSDRMAASAQEAERAALARINAEQAEARKAKLPSFWLPSLTPTEAEAPPKVLAEKLQTLCKAADERGHRITMKSLIPVKFSLQDPDDKICAGCKKVLATSSVLYALKQCGHVHCSTCVSTLIQPSEHPACIECDTPLKLEKAAQPVTENNNNKDAVSSTPSGPAAKRKIKEGELIKLQREGTGYAAGGVSVVEKKGTAFQG